MKKTEEIRNEIKEKKYDIMPNQKTGTIPLYKKLKAGIIALFAKDKNQHRDSLLKAGAILASVPAIVFSVTACQVETEEEHTLVQKSVENFTSVSELKEECEKIYSVKDNVIANIENIIKDNYGENVKICSIYYDWKDKFDGDIFAIVNINGKVEILKFLNQIDIEDISKTIYKNGTYELEDNVLKYYTYNGENTLDLTNQKFFIEEETGDLIIIENLNTLDDKIKESFGEFEKVDTNLSYNLDEEKQNDAKYAMQYFLQSDTEAFFLNTSLSYDENQDKTMYSVSYLSETKTYNLIKFEFSGNVVAENGLLDRDMAEEQFKYYEVATSEIKTNTVGTAPVALIKEDMFQTIKLYSNQEYIDNGNLPPEQIEINSWEELFNVLGEEYQEIIKNKFKYIFEENVKDLKNLKELFGEEASYKNSKILEIALNFNDDEIIDFKILGTFTSSKNKTSLVRGEYIFLEQASLQCIDIKLYKKVVAENKYIISKKVSDGFLVLDFTELNDLISEKTFLSNNERIDNFSEEFTESQILSYNLLMPLIIQEQLIDNGLEITKIEIYNSYGNDSDFGITYQTLIRLFIQKLNRYIVYSINLDYEEAESREEGMKKAIKDGLYKVAITTNEKLIESDWHWTTEYLLPKFIISELNKLEK